MEGRWRNTGVAEGDRYADIKNLTGPPWDDSLRGDAQDNHIIALRGNDWLVGRDGDDTLVGDGGNDVFMGDAGQDVLIGGTGTDRADYRDTTVPLTADLAKPWRNTGISKGDSYDSIEYIFGSWQNDILMGGAGADLLVGGHGFDRADYREATTSVAIDMPNYHASTGEAAGDIFYDIEALFGTGFGDSISGNNAPNTLWGHHGEDDISGMRGTDTLDGGLSDAVLFGGTGLDVFIYAQGQDRIADFNHREDQLMLDDALWQNQGFSAKQVLNSYGREIGRDVVLKSAPWNVLTVNNTTLSQVEDMLLLY